MQLSEHFSLEELIASETALRCGIDNTPASGILENLKLLAIGLEDVRNLLGHPIHVNSGYRCPALNRKVKGSRNSDHMIGLAADIICPQFGNPLAICWAIHESDLVYDQVIDEGEWCHIGFGTSASVEMRKMALTAFFQAGKATTYREGLG